MSTLLPPRFLFRYSLPVRHEARVPRTGKKLLGLSPAFALPDLAALEGAKPFAELRLAWNQRGLGISVEVRGRRTRPRCNPAEPDTTDGLRVWIDTRNTQNIHRASRFCHDFCLLPSGGGSNGKNPVARQIAIARAREETPLSDPDDIRLAAEIGKDGYRLEAWLPATVLNGYDPDLQPRLGFYYAVRDGELGEQYVSVGPEFPFAFDPSLWATLELVK